MLAIAKIAKNRKKFVCTSCDYSTSNSFDFKKHQQTEKHASVSQAMAIDNSAMGLREKSQKKEFICLNCNKVYKDNSGLWRHKKKCDVDYSSECSEEISNQITPELILNVLKQNKELTDLVVEQNKTIMELAKNGQGQDRKSVV